jgi:hypothetical protein
LGEGQGLHRGGTVDVAAEGAVATTGAGVGSVGLVNRQLQVGAAVLQAAKVFIWALTVLGLARHRVTFREAATSCRVRALLLS